MPSGSTTGGWVPAMTTPTPAATCADCRTATCAPRRPPQATWSGSWSWTRRTGTMRPARKIRTQSLALLLLIGMGAVVSGCAHPSARVSATAAVSSVPATPHSIAERLTLSEQQERAGETFAAIEQIEAARILGENEQAANLRLARLYDSVGEFEQAATVLGQAAGRPGASPDVRVAWSQALFKLGDFPGADRAVRPLLPQASRLPDPMRRTIARTLLLADDLQ